MAIKVTKAATKTFATRSNANTVVANLSIKKKIQDIVLGTDTDSSTAQIAKSQ